MLFKTTTTAMKCDNPSVDSFVNLPSPPVASSSLNSHHHCNTTNYAENTDVQLIYNKKRRFRQHPSRIPRSLSNSSTLTNHNNISSRKEVLPSSDEIESDSVEDVLFDNIDENDEEMAEGRIRREANQRSKLILQPQLYKSFLANALRVQKSAVNSLDCGSADSSPHVTFSNFNGGLHIFPRNLLFSCSGDRTSPSTPWHSSASSGGSLKPKDESPSRSSPHIPLQEVGPN